MRWPLLLRRAELTRRGAGQSQNQPVYAEANPWTMQIAVCMLHATALVRAFSYGFTVTSFALENPCRECTKTGARTLMRHGHLRPRRVSCHWRQVLHSHAARPLRQAEVVQLALLEELGAEVRRRVLRLPPDPLWPDLRELVRADVVRVLR